MFPSRFPAPPTFTYSMPTPLVDYGVADVYAALVGVCPNTVFEFHSEYVGTKCRIFRFRRLHGDGSTKGDVAVRVNHRVAKPPDAILDTVRYEAMMLQKLGKDGFPWAPRCVAASLTFENAVRYPFVVVTWAKGRKLEWSESEPSWAPRAYVLKQLYKIQLELVDLTLETQPMTAKEFIMHTINNRLTEHRQVGSQGRLSEQDYFSQMLHLDQVVGTDSASTLYAAFHQNLVPSNIIVDDQHNIECIIDWTFSSMVPLCVAVSMPRFIAPPTHTNLPPTEQAIRDRRDYAYGLIQEVVTPTSQLMKKWQFNEDAPHRALYILSLVHKDAHIFMAQCNWSPRYYPFVNQVPRPPKPPKRQLPVEYEPENKGRKIV